MDIDYDSMYKFRGMPDKNDVEELRKNLNIRIKERFIESIIRREGLSKKDIELECKEMGFDLRSDRFALISVKIVAWEKSFYNEDFEISERLRRFVRFIILNITEELLGKEHGVSSLVVDGNYCCVVNLHQDESDQSFFDELTESVKIIEKNLSETCGVTIQMDSSAVVVGMERLDTAYDQVKDIERYRRMLENDELLLSYGEISGEPDKKHDFFANEQAISNLVRTGEFGRAKEEMLDIIVDIRSSHLDFHSVHYLYNRMTSVVHTMANLAQQQTGSPEFWEELDPPRAISGAASFSELGSVVECLFEKIDSYGKDGAEIPKWFPQLVSMVENDYADPNINVNTLANALGITATHLSRTFRKFRGIGLPDYIHVIRIEAAKKYIAEGYSIKKVTELVGYANQLTMSRAFRKFEGYSPGQYFTEKSI